MFYDTAKNDHGLPHNPFKAIVSPRPIGWVSTVDAQGRSNLAPYSFFNAVCDTPPMVMFSSSQYKDSISNAESTGEFVCNMCSFDLMDEMNKSSAPLASGVSEFEASGLEAAACKLVDAPRVAKAYAALECKVIDVRRLTGLNGQETNNWVAIGQVVGVHIREDALVDGRFDVTKVRPLSRLGYLDYAVVDDVFELERPGA
ncbi:MAG: flavin reductase family protein [Rhodobacteraceae bacterium]|nr:flavin reductase family protein [Paracoccaceae bacterium]